MSQEHRTEIAQLAIWTKKFLHPFQKLLNASIQKISATVSDEMILSVFKYGTDKSSVILSIKKGDSGIYLSDIKPQTLQKPNSIVQITRKYLQGRRVENVFATLSPICVVIECFNKREETEDDKEINQGPDTLILNLDERPPKIVLAKKYTGVPERYTKDCGKNFQEHDIFFESWCEWSCEITKTKRRLFHPFPLVGYCPFTNAEKIEQVSYQTPVQNTEQHIPVHVQNPFSIPATSLLLNKNSQLELFPTHIRRSIKTKLLFLERRLTRQKSDLPHEKDIVRLKKQSEGLKSSLYLWPDDSLIWYVPPSLIEEFHLNPIYKIKKGQKQGHLLEEIHREIDILTRREQELKKRLEESHKESEEFNHLIVETIEEIKQEIDHYIKEKNIKITAIDKKILGQIFSNSKSQKLSDLCKILNINLIKSTKEDLQKKIEKSRLPYRTFITSVGEEIRVSKSAQDGDDMLKLMPSNHYWLHVLEGEGSHIWIKKNKNQSQLSEETQKEAAILAVHYSKHSKNMTALVQIAFRSDIEKKKNLEPGKVLVRRSKTFIVKYEKNELKMILEKGLKN